jgi:acyl carrier protein
MSEEAMRARVRAFILQRFPTVAARNMTDDDSLLDSGVIDSLGVLDLAAFIERELGVQLADDDLTAENFESIATLSRFLAAKRAA